MKKLNEIISKAWDKGVRCEEIQSEIDVPCVDFEE